MSNTDVVEVGIAGADVEASLAGMALGRPRLRFGRTVALSVGIQGPTAGVIVGPAVLAGIVGGSGALAYLLGLVAMGFVAYAFVLFSRSFNSAGSVYAYNGAALGPSYGFVSAWSLLLVYTSFAAAVYASTADIAQSLFAAWGIHLWWVWFALVGFALTVVFAYLSIGLSSAVIFACEGLAIALLAVVGIAVVVSGGAHHHPALSFAPFHLHGIAFSVLGLGVVNAFGAFSGFEGAATLGEEARRSTRTIPAAVAWSLAGSGIAYVVFTWIADNAYASPGALAADPAPFVHLARAHLGPAMADAVNIAGVISAFGAQLACINAANRILFALGRDLTRPAGRARALLTLTSRRHGSPIGALAVTAGASIAALLAFSFEASAVRALTIIVEFGAYLMIVTYLLTVVAAIAWAWRRQRRPLPLAVLATGLAVLGYVLYDTFVPLPPAPFNWVIVASAAALATGIGIAAAPVVRRRLQASSLLRASRLQVRGAPVTETLT
ncbi:MAG TPA: APC family permease [Acidimicrobiales bacterium]|nr:APC family permease [Acidimicrobiales bacterium]